jgi:two-component system chemotaxis sensor kinase CheA
VEVRRLAKSLGKRVGLGFEGESTLVDRVLLERLHDPLLHIIRNAVSHGIETPDERTAAGKPVEGRVLVRARQESNHMRIDVKDDGRGIDIAKIKAVARAKGISLRPEDAAVDLIFRPGFSTKEDVDDVSGRGVGLDAARTQVDGMRGVTAVDSQPGTGTTFSIWVPLTLAVSRGILVEEGGIPVIVPLGSVTEIVSLRDGLQGEMIERGTISCKGQEFRFLSLSKRLGLSAEAKPDYAVITGVGVKSQAIGVGKVCGETEIVSRPLPPAVGAPCFVSGAAELHDGRAAIIVQPGEMSRAMPAVGQRPETGCISSLSARELIEGWRSGNLLDLLVFRSGSELFASPLCLLKEVVQIRSCTRLPSLGNPWQGLFFVRGMCHALAKLGHSSGTDNVAVHKAVVYRVPERCGVAADTVGSTGIPYRKLKIAADRPGRDPFAPVATFEWKAQTVAVVDIGGVFRQVLAAVEGRARNGGHLRSKEALMQASSPDDK